MLNSNRLVPSIIAAAGWLAVSTAHAVQTTPIFGRPVASGIQGIGYEQTLRIDSNGVMYTSVPDGAPGGLDWVWVSYDNGQTFKWIPNAAPLSGKLSATCPGGGGGDSELAVDPQGRLYFNELTLANFSTSVSFDQGKTFAFSCAGVPTVVDDRQWYAVDGDPFNGGNIFLAYDQVLQAVPGTCSPGVANNQLVIARSPLAMAPVTAGLEFNAVNRVSAQCDEGIMGNVEVSPVTHHVFVVHDNDTLDKIMVARCVVVDFTVDPSGLTCVDLPVTSFPGYVTGGNFPTIAIDGAGKLYALWERAPCSVCGQGATVTGDTLLYMSTSTDEGNHWSLPAQVPTPGLHQNVFGWIVAGDSGRIAIAWYGTNAQPPNNTGGPDTTYGDWSLYFVQSLNGGLTFTAPMVPSEHFIHRGTMQSLLGGQKGDRTLGDFLTMRVGLKGEAVISYADSNNLALAFMGSQATVVRQVGGPTLLAGKNNYCGGTPAVNMSHGAAGNATLDISGLIHGGMPNLDLLSSSVSQPNPLSSNYRITMTVADLTTLTPAPAVGGTYLVWSTQWHVPSLLNPNGGHIFHVYMESNNGAAPTYWVGENADLPVVNGGNGTLTYPGNTQVTGSYTATAPGTITIDVPASAVADQAPVSTTLYSVTSATMSLPASASSNPPLSGIGGVPFNLIDVLPPYDYIPGAIANAGACPSHGHSGHQEGDDDDDDEHDHPDGRPHDD